MKHSKECLEQQELHKLAVERFKKHHPNYCKTCNGWGGSTSTYDPSPSGVSLGSGYMYDHEPCQDCMDKMKCPWCGADLQENEEASFWMPGQAPVIWCENCEWNETKEDGIPEAPECFCWLEEEL